MGDGAGACRSPTRELQTVIDHLAVREAQGGVPRLDLDAPVRAYSDDRNLLSWEYVQFLPRDRSNDAWPLIAIRARPDGRRSSRSGVRDGGPWVEAWEDTDLGLQVAAYGKATGKSTLRARASEVASSIRRVE